MGRHQIVLSDDLSDLLRRKALKKGDISKIIEEALRKHLQEYDR
jgi:hypothetical protein